ncbi:ccr4 associated factor [Mucor velutinosus]|uniref:Ccr4 associated factor n=1 Tax=Mucor velutinosus TaxID=708070 RepID=A0AAN7DLF8_9FUNG|nr:ccr4 associated factor [Mucor velutinosus]
MMPAVFESHNCPVCLSPNETASHLLFDCPSKVKVWQGVIFEFLWPTTTITDIKEALLSLDFSDIWYSQVKGIRPYSILLITLFQIWLAHMRFVFDNIILVPEAILENIRSTVRQTVEEDQIHSLL